MRLAVLFSLALLFILAYASVSAVEPSGSEAVGILDIKADTIIIDTGSQQFEASGNVRITYDRSSLVADQVSGNALTREITATGARAQVDSLRVQGQEITTRRVPAPGTPEGYRLEYVIRDGLATTCDLDRPDYRISAREIVVQPDERATARKVSLWLGNFRVLTVPKFVVGLGPRREQESFLPRPGFDDDDGFFVSLRHQLVSSSKTGVALDMRATTKNGIQGGVAGDWLLAGRSRSGDPESQINLAARPLLLPVFDEETGVGVLNVQRHIPASQARVYANLLHRQRVYDIDRTELLLTKSPEIGVRWVSNAYQITGGGGLSVYAAAQASWGRFKERSGPLLSRFDARLSLAALPKEVFRDTYFQPAVSFRSSNYADGDLYRVFGFSADVTHKLGRAYISGRYLSHSTDGHSPFEFDDIDRKREMQGAFLYSGRLDGISLLMRYSLDQNDLYDWSLSYSRKLHCLQPTATWHNRFGLFSIDVKVLGL